LADPLLQGLLESRAHLGAVQQFAGGDAYHPVAQLVGAALGQVQFPLGHAQPGQPDLLTCPHVHAQQHRFLFVAEQFGVGQGARRHHPHHFALHRPLAGGRVAHLLANGHRFAQLDQSCQVTLDRVEGHPRHQHWLSGRLATLGQGDVEQACGFFGVLVEQLVKVTHAVEQQSGRKPGLEAQVLLHHGGVVLQAVARGTGLDRVHKTCVWGWRWDANCRCPQKATARARTLAVVGRRPRADV